MQTRSTPRALAVLASLVVALLFAPPASADDWQLTGAGVRTRTVESFEFAIYDIQHFVRGPLAEKSKHRVMVADVSKKVVWTMRRDVKAETMQSALRGGFARNGYADSSKIALFVNAFHNLHAGQRVTITYDTDRKLTVLAIEGGSAVAVVGVEFMRAVWAQWFGGTDQPALGEQLIAKLP
ncbi:MAG: chalcone isomerase family protein [Myxococcales bacterium]|jgi:hypothetical protein|nr:chalcone isomerase family protein [Myxococcales bacterium]MBL0196672.1 chalcone isomerase family protein [Myxococcales bacterium]HQY61352.1 chalcone isomerase family protein [Polyangiaceae bacterium]